MIIKGAFADIGAFGDVVNRGEIQSLFGKKTPGSLQKLLPGKTDSLLLAGFLRFFRLPLNGLCTSRFQTLRS